MFHIFGNQSERREFGGSGFLELQYCRMEPETEIGKIVSASEIEHWKEDSLYVYFDDIDDFYEQYVDIFKDGIYNDLKSGMMDIYGINYYSREKVEEIIEVVEKEMPKEHEILLTWIGKAKKSNGFYILGI